ncbi:hypothetical protein AX17_002202 [Amanita inopinata Kibby_2008]|nr:hypothetical protein AX17_002202 [Amanita inopinata Kibby_2008]
MAQTLPVDVYLSIFNHLTVEDLLNIRRTCKTFAELTRLRSVWHYQLLMRVLDQDIPIPRLFDKSIDALGARELEGYTVRALRLRRRWCSPTPGATHRRSIRVHQGQIYVLHFIRHCNHRYLLSLALLKPNTNHTWDLSLWDLQEADAPCVAQRIVTGLKGFTVNVVPGSPAIVALQSSQHGLELLGLDLTTDDASAAFITLSRCPTFHHRVRHLSGTNLVSVDGNSNAFLWNTDNPDCEIELQVDHHEHDVRNYVLREVMIQDRFVFVNRAKLLILYALPQEIPTSGTLVLRPIAEYSWQWSVDSICMSPQIYNRASLSGRLAPMNILLRFGSFLPWPINLLHYFTLGLNPSYNPHQPPSRENVPYRFPPELRRTFAAPVLLFSTTHMVMGPHGTALWIDNHTEDYFRSGDRGQRIASVFCPVLERSGDEEGGGGGGGAEAEAGQPESTASTMATTVYIIQEGDGWTTLAMDEVEGIIAVGSQEGQIIVMDYA